MRYAPMAVSTRDSLLGLVYEECWAKYYKHQPAHLALVSTKLLSKLEAARLLEDLEREYDNKV